ncbi:hypothetical protein NQ317_012175 [Molorchus minor]|uniref:Uncharacterized protein n=1 Tax=Molorchus minor TaxID=1323400 RepID=A0ABQ9K2T7_9CUCU|nr:hypothetical protein NQ317_012175 [Molorchus minor]
MGDKMEIRLAAQKHRYRRVIAFICGLIVIILMIMGLASTDWLMAAGWRQGLFMHCIEQDAPQPLPFNMVDPPGCYQSRDAGLLNEFWFIKRIDELAPSGDGDRSW